jgi:hypothetical protein
MRIDTVILAHAIEQTRLTDPASYMLTTWNVKRSGGSDETGSGAMCDQVVYAVVATLEFK